MGEWVQFANSVMTVLLRVAAVLLVIGLAWNFTHIIIDIAVGGQPRALAMVLFNVLGLIGGFLLVALAPTIVNETQALFRSRAFP